MEEMDTDGDGTVTKEEFEVWWTEWSALMAEDAPAAPVAASVAPVAASTDANAFEAEELRELLADMDEADAAEALQEIGIDAVRRLRSVRRLEIVNAWCAGAQTGDISIAAMRAALSAHYSESQGLSLRSALHPISHGFHQQLAARCGRLA